MTDQERFEQNGTQMPKTMQDMYDYDSSLAALIDRFDRENNPQFDINEQLLLYNFLKDLQLYKKLYGSFSDASDKLDPDKIIRDFVHGGRTDD